MGVPDSLSRSPAGWPDPQALAEAGATGETTIIKSVLTASVSPPGSDGVRLAENVLLLIVHDGSGRLIDLSGPVLAVSESGGSMLELALRQGAEVASTTLAARYGVAPEVIRADLATLLASLADQGLLVPASVATDRGSFARAAAWIAYPLVAICARRPLRGTNAKASLLMVLAFVATRIFGWANAMRVWDRAGQRLASAADAGEAEPAIEAAIDKAVTRAIARHPLTVN